ncbi:hypothetical protein [Plesiomonas shigelloides]|uniref:hypothetical protein n=1 Tax=Plesiomonas shigelloides TaxID=703 RepID=UPI001261C527|nr:hypothetical protein [Plesiomonas shigelloides]KAB7669201.1 hypothetical protein GBN25_02905 [Plesiomonas shigelloides]
MEQNKTCCWVRILDPNGTYLEKDSVLPVHVDDELKLVVTEEYESESPCEHFLNELTADGVLFEKVAAPF